MPTKYQHFKCEQEWLAAKALDVSSTESAALFGLSPYATELELFYRKQSGEIHTLADNARMKAGRFLEPSIAQFAGDELGCEVQPFPAYARDPDVRMGSSFDWQVANGDFAGWILEIKNVDFLVYRDQWEDDEAPDHIEVQVQHQLELTGRPGAIIACLVGGNDLRIIKRERNEKMGRGIRQRIKRFWDDVDNDKPPEPDYIRDADFLISLHAWAGEAVLDANDHEHIKSRLDDYKRLKSEEADIAKITKAIKAEILDIVGDDYSRIITDKYSVAIPNVGGKVEEFVYVTPDMLGETVDIEITDKMVGQEITVPVTDSMVNGELILSPARTGYRMFRVTEKKQK